MTPDNVIPLPMRKGPGASPAEWAHFEFALELGEDLLPVVSNLKATISPESTLQALGKTPSRYNGNRHVAGIAKWTELRATPAQIAAWAKEPDYGICLQTRHVRALDIDVPDSDASAVILAHIEAHLGRLPVRARADSGKKLVAFRIATGEFTKRSFKTNGGIVEFLASGQQFIACGTHPAGARYEWRGGLPDDFPTISAEQFDALWQSLVERFAVEAPTTSAAPTKQQKLKDVIASDPVAQYLLDKSMVKRADQTGRLDITCPFESEHTQESSDSATSYWPRFTGGYANGHFLCMHAHCEKRTDQEFLDAIGFVDSALLTEFDAISELSAQASATVTPETAGDAGSEPSIIPESTRPDAGNPSPFKFPELSAFAFGERPAPRWIIKRVLPQAEVCVIYGASGSGKSFLVLDMAMAIELGQPWRGHKVRQGRVVYVPAEGAAGFRNRLRAYGQQHNVDLKSLRMGVIASTPNIMDKADALDLARSIHSNGDPAVIIIDTLAQTMPGANENAGEDMGRALAHCKGLHRATGALVILIHHSGKDAAKGARGWSGLRAAADTEIEIMCNEEDRVATITKQKDGEDGAEYGFRLTTVPIGFDEDGDEITSCIVEETAKTRKDTQKKRAPGSNEKLVLQVFDDLMTVGEDGVFANEIVAGVAAQMLAPEDGKRDRRRNLAHQALEAAIANGRLRLDGDKVKYPTGD